MIRKFGKFGFRQQEGRVHADGDDTSVPEV
jgi:hypothetical protein